MQADEDSLPRGGELLGRGEQELGAGAAPPVPSG